MTEQDRKNIDLLAEQYRINRIGYIACNYTKEQEEAVYLAASKILSSKYPNLATRDDIYETLNTKGNIYTIYKYKGDPKSGLLDNGKNCNVLIPYFLKRMTENLLHELTHKIGFIKADDSFLLMNREIRECGTELVASSALSVKDARYFVLPGIAGKYPEHANSGLLEFSLVNQLNTLVGNDKLEKSILQGHDYFKEAIIQKYGAAFYEEVASRISFIENQKMKFYDLYSSLGEDNKKVADMSKDLTNEVLEFQDDILRMELDSRFGKVSSAEEGKRFLEELNFFGRNRLQVQSPDGTFEDKRLEGIFNVYKAKIEQTYGTVEVNFERFKLEDLPQLEISEDLEPGELLDIEQMAAKFEIQSRKRLKDSRKSGFRKWIEKFVHSNQKPLALPNSTNTFEKDIQVDDVKGEISQEYSNNQNKIRDEKIK